MPGTLGERSRRCPPAPSFGSLRQGSLVLRELSTQVKENTGQGSQLRARGHPEIYPCCSAQGVGESLCVSFWYWGWDMASPGQALVFPAFRREHVPCLSRPSHNTVGLGALWAELQVLAAWSVV